MDLYTFLLLAGVIVLGIFLEYFRDQKYWNRIDRLLNRLQSQNYQEFRYYEDQYKRDLTSAEEQVKEARETVKKEEEIFEEDRRSPKTPLNLEDLEEDWNEDEVKKVEK